MRCAIWFVQAVAGGYCRSISGTGARSTGWFRELAQRFLFQTIHDVELMPDREQAGRDGLSAFCASLLQSCQSGIG